MCLSHMARMARVSVIVLSVLAARILCLPSNRIFYLLYTKAKSWNDAKMTCERDSQSLLIEKDDVTAQVLAHFNTDPDWDIYLSGHDNWIGLHRQHMDANSSYVWHDCSEIGSYSNWEIGQPNGSGLCVSTSWSTGKWRLTKCDTELPFICEKYAGSCQFHIKRGMKHPDVNSDQFTTKSATACQNLCSKAVKAGQECWALTYFQSDGACFLHFSELLLNTENVELIKESKADVHFKQCFKAYILPYSVHMDYSSAIPNQGCWNNDVTSNASSVIPERNTSVSPVHITSQAITGGTSADFLISTVEGSQKVLLGSQASSNDRTADSVVETSSTIVLSSSNVFSSAGYLNHDPPKMKISDTTETITSHSSLYADTSELYLEPSPVSMTNLPNTQAYHSVPVAESSTSGSNGSVECWCPCAPKVPENLTTDEMIELAEDIVRDIKIDKNNLSSAQRKLISVTDERTSAQGIGVIGVVILSGVFGAIIGLDFLTLCKSIWQLWQNSRNPSIEKLENLRSEQIFLNSFSEESTTKCKLIFDTN